MTGNDQAEGGLTPKQEAFLTAYLASSNITVAARTAGMADKTARRLVKESKFRQALKEAQRDLFDQALDGLRSHVDTAIATLVRHMTNEETQPAQQIRAAQLYLELAIQHHEIDEIKDMVALLEAKLQAKGIEL